MATPGIITNSELALKIAQLVDRWNTRENQLRLMLTQPTGTVTVTDGLEQNHELPSFPQLQLEVQQLIADATTGINLAEMHANTALQHRNAAGEHAQEAQDAAEAAQASAASIGDAEQTTTANAAAAASSAAAAAQSEDTAEAHKTHAASSSMLADAAADDAEVSRLAAAGSATAADSARTGAEAARDKAALWADAPLNTQVEPGKYSAKHWADQAAATVTGTLTYMGTWSPASGAFPPAPKTGHFYKVSAAGTHGGYAWSVGDHLIYNGTTWDAIDNTESVTSVAGRVGAVTLTTADIGGLGALATLGTVDFGTRVSGKPTTLAGYGITDAMNTSSSQDVGGFKTMTYGALRIQGWAGTANAGVLYLGDLDRYVYKPQDDDRFLFKIGNTTTAFLDAGGTIVTTNNLAAAATNYALKAGATFTGNIGVQQDVPQVFLANAAGGRQYRMLANINATVDYGLQFDRWTGSAWASRMVITDQVNTLVTANNFVGGTGTQQIIRGMGWGNQVARWKEVMEPDGGFAWYSYDTAGGNPIQTFSFKTAVAGGSEGVWFRGQAMWHAGNFNPASKANVSHTHAWSEVNPPARLGVNCNLIYDWNVATENGWFMGSNAANAPSADWYMGEVIVHNPDWVVQRLIRFAANVHIEYQRTRSGGTWGGWERIYNTQTALDERYAYPYSNFVFRDLTATRGDGSGVVFLNQTQSRYLYYSGARYEMPGAPLSINGGPNITSESGQLRVEGTVRTYNRNVILAANGGAWNEQPRVFVTSGDPGAWAQDGDLWVW